MTQGQPYGVQVLQGYCVAVLLQPSCTCAQSIVQGILLSMCTGVKAGVRQKDLEHIQELYAKYQQEEAAAGGEECVCRLPACLMRIIVFKHCTRQGPPLAAMWPMCQVSPGCNARKTLQALVIQKHTQNELHSAG